MRREELKIIAASLFEFGEDKWFDYEDEFIQLAKIIENITLDRAADHCKNLSASATLVSYIRGLKT